MSAVDVNETRINASSAGHRAWWAFYRKNADSVGRAQVLKATVGGDLVRIHCDDEAHATWLATYLTDRVGMPASAIRLVKDTK